MNAFSSYTKLLLAAFSIIVVTVITGCGGGSSSSGSADWYYHWSCNGDSQCLALGPGATNQASGTLNEGPAYAACSPLLTFAAHNWNMPPATDSCDQSSATPTPILSLRSITVTPANKVLPLGSTQQYVATATYSDGTSADVTTKATWSAGNGVICSTVCVATISPSGMATTYATGSITIKATQGVISGSTALYVTAATLQSITVSPANPTINQYLTQQFTATGHYSDGTSQVLSSVSWGSGTLATATINSTGLASAV
ncbi:MAG TPA: Ig-like domain-containing protein, partial [Candidatus Saccharimonadales bacterium]